MFVSAAVSTAVADAAAVMRCNWKASAVGAYLLCELLVLTFPHA